MKKVLIFLPAVRVNWAFTGGGQLSGVYTFFWKRLVVQEAQGFWRTHLHFRTHSIWKIAAIWNTAKSYGKTSNTEENGEMQICGATPVQQGNVKTLP